MKKQFKLPMLIAVWIVVMLIIFTAQFAIIVKGISKRSVEKEILLKSIDSLRDVIEQEKVNCLNRRYLYGR